MRHNPYAFPHKGLRHAMTGLLTSLDGTDPGNRSSIHSIKTQWDEFTFLFFNHSESEDNVLLPAIMDKAGHAFNQQDDIEEHHRLEQQVKQLDQKFQALPDTATAEQYEQVRTEANRVVPQLLLHMQSEESRLLPVLWEHFSDDEINALHARVMSSFTPGQMLLWFKYIAPSLSPSERTVLIQLLKKESPGPFFEQLMQIAQGVLDEDEYSRVAAL